MKLILLGAPGAGKGTQAENISKRLNIPTISTGNILREAIAAGSELGKQANTFIEKGELVPDDVVISIVKERLAQSDCKNGFILDGFPRTVAQAEALEKMGMSIDKVIDIEVQDSDIMERLSGRRTCPNCGASYHVKYKPSAKGEYCDKCGTKLTIRKDDAPDTIRERLEVYHSLTEPLKEYYSKAGKLKVVLGQEELEATTKLTMAALEE
jgi:adenylate kinase